MSDKYLWDKAGEPDPEVERLEKTLERYRSRDRESDTQALLDAARELDERRAAGAGRAGGAPSPEHAERGARGWRWPWVGRPARTLIGLAAAAAVLAIAGIPWLASHRSGWEVTALEGTPRAGARLVRKNARLPLGEWLVTDGTSRARVAVGQIGEVVVEPLTRLRVVPTRGPEHRLALDRGRLHAMIFAPPRQFVVETASAVAVDLGCEYMLEINEAGAGHLRVLSGWVAFERGGRESFVPAGARCDMAPGVGPGTPCFEDAPNTVRQALDTIDFGSPSGEARAAALAALLAESRPEDALTLWHLLTRLSGAERERVYGRLATLVPPPAGVSRKGVLAGDRSMIDRWWDELGLGDTSWWRMWKGDVP